MFPWTIGPEQGYTRPYHSLSTEGLEKEEKELLTMQEENEKEEEENKEFQDRKLAQVDQAM